MSSFVDPNRLPAPENARPYSPANMRAPLSMPNAMPNVMPNASASHQKPTVNFTRDEGASNVVFEEHVSHVVARFGGKLANMEGQVIFDTVDEKNARKVFGNSFERPIHDVKVAAAENGNNNVDLTRAIVTKVKVTGVHNGLPYPVDFNTADIGINTGRVTLSGKPSLFSAPPNYTKMGLDVVVFDGKNCISDPVLNRYGPVTMKELESRIQKINGPTGASYAMVPYNHELIDFMRRTSARWGPIDEASKSIMSGFYALEPGRVSRVLDAMNEMVLSRFNFTNLEKFSVSLSRPDGSDLKDLDGSLWGHHAEEDRNAKLEENFFASVDLEVTWTSPQKPKQNTVANVENFQNMRLGDQNYAAIPVSGPRGY